MQMQKIRKERLSIAALAALLVVSLIGGTWGAWAQQLTTVNEYKLGKYSTELVEEFTPPKDWLPGIEINKDVAVANNGTIPVFVKVVINQEWIRRENVLDSNGNVVPPTRGNKFPLFFQAITAQGTHDEYAALIGWGAKDIVLLRSGMALSSSLSLGLTTVGKVEDAEGKWLLVDETPDANGNLTFYYIGTLEGGEETPRLVDSVTMNPNILPTTTEIHTTYDKVNKKWVTVYIENSTASYENARYTMQVTMSTVQATEEAVKELFASGSTSEQSVVSYLATVAGTSSSIDHSYDDSVKTKTLYVVDNQGKLSYVPVRNTDEHWFMSHLNMVPGGNYSDTLDIINETNRTFELYMRVVPLDQDVMQDELLELISMKVTYDGTVIYEGTAMGKEYTNSINDLHKAIMLGVYGPKVENKIKVELTLDKDTPIKYSDLLTKIDWEFMIVEIVSSNPDGPRTGDYNQNWIYYTMEVVCAIVASACIVLLIKKKRGREQ